MATYEMLWDCAFCGQKKLLGKTHRFCASCGAAQDEKARYFPDDADKVLVKDHVFVGADKVCPGCDAPMSAQAKNCTACGSPLDGAKDAARRAETTAKSGDSAEAARSQLSGRPAATPKPAPKQEGVVQWGNWRRDLKILAAFVAGLIALFVFLGRTESASLRVTGHHWKRTIDVETYGPVDDSAWCDAMPSGARNVTRTREVRSHNKVADGEDCSTSKHDNGDGTYSERETCKTRYRSEPVYDSRCHYTIDIWHLGRVALSEGDLAKARAWPAIALAKAGQCVGCEREGKRAEEYVVELARTDKPEEKARTCVFDETRWTTFEVGSEWTMDVGAVLDYADCDSLRAQP